MGNKGLCSYSFASRYVVLLRKCDLKEKEYGSDRTAIFPLKHLMKPKLTPQFQVTLMWFKIIIEKHITGLGWTKVKRKLAYLNAVKIVLSPPHISGITPASLQKNYAGFFNTSEAWTS